MIFKDLTPIDIMLVVICGLVAFMVPVNALRLLTIWIIKKLKGETEEKNSQS